MRPWDVVVHVWRPRNLGPNQHIGFLKVQTKSHVHFGNCRRSGSKVPAGHRRAGHEANLRTQDQRGFMSSRFVACLLSVWLATSLHLAGLFGWLIGRFAVSLLS